MGILKRRSVQTTTTTVAPQRVPPTSRPVSSQSVQSISSRPASIRVTQSVPQVVTLAPPVVEDDDEQSMDIKEVVREDPHELMNAIRGVETMIEDQYQPYDDHVKYVWPEVPPERAERYRRQVQANRDVQTTTTTVAPQRVPPASQPVSSQPVQSISSHPASIRVTQSVPQVVTRSPSHRR